VANATKQHEQQKEQHFMKSFVWQTEL